MAESSGIGSYFSTNYHPVAPIVAKVEAVETDEEEADHHDDANSSAEREDDGGDDDSGTSSEPAGDLGGEIDARG